MTINRRRIQKTTTETPHTHVETHAQSNRGSPSMPTLCAKSKVPQSATFRFSPPHTLYLKYFTLRYVVAVRL